MFSSNQTKPNFFRAVQICFLLQQVQILGAREACVSFAMLLRVYGVDARWLKLVRKTDEHIVISSCQTVRNTKTISTVIKITKRKNLSYHLQPKQFLKCLVVQDSRVLKEGHVIFKKTFASWTWACSDVLSFRHFCCI